ncbi:hypothetical protein [Terriglobus sp.]|uniref:hypothetical protein n=1 Tax=Terriglobus sp. TaxID=1889013 RepID=UPI003B00AA8F
MFFRLRRPARSFLWSVAALSLPLAPACAQAPVSASVAAANKAELVDRVHEFQGNTIWSSKLIGSFNWNLSEAAWKVMLSAAGVNGVAFLSKDAGNYIKAHGGGDLDRTEDSNNGDRKSAQGQIDQMIAQSKDKFSFSMEATQPSLSPAQSSLMLNYLASVAGFIDRGDWTPRGGHANIKLQISSTAKDVAVITSKDATDFTIVAPLSEPSDWGGKIERGLKRGGE